MTNQETNKLYSCVHSLCKRQMSFFFYVIWKMKHQLKSRFVASDLAVGCLRAVVDVFRVVDLVCLVFFLFISLFLLLLGKKEHFNECSTLFLTLFGKNTVMPTLSTVELFSSVCARVCVCRFFLLLSCALEISFEAYMFYRGDKIMLKFVQHSAKYPLFSQRLRELLQFQAKPDTDRTLYRNLNGSIGCFESKNLLFSLGLTSTDPKSAGVWVRKMAAV